MQLLDKDTVGVDEVGRGSLMGNVVVCALRLDPKHYDYLFSLGLKGDSKKLSKRKYFADLVNAIMRVSEYSIGECSHEEIEDRGIWNATRIAAERAIEKINPTPSRIVVDGEGMGITTSNAVIEYHHKADERFFQVACASCIAKYYRDEQVRAIAPQYPEYDWASNKGYGTIQHREAILNHGVTPLHRKRFLRKLLG